MKRLLYVIRMNEFYKIGIARDLVARLRMIQTGTPYELEVIATYKLRDARAMESWLHKYFKDKRHRGEWYLLDDLDLDKIRLACLHIYEPKVINPRLFEAFIFAEYLKTTYQKG
jgi:hypothetical protein